MAGYVFAIGSNVDPVEVIKECAATGVYSTYINTLSSNPFEGTLTDYISMQPGDNIYFFCKRKYYGVGELISVGDDCKYCNYPGSTLLQNYKYEDIADSLLVDYGNDSDKNRWICTFKGAPYMFEDGIDTDEILQYKPSTFKMLRAFWKVSFIKLGDEENESMKEIFLLRHQENIMTGSKVFSVSDSVHDSIKARNLKEYTISPWGLLDAVSNEKRLKHEMALEAGVVYDLCHDRLKVLGHWDYVSHQVIASPFKPIDYMDKIDVFATRYLTDTKIPCKYLVAELKKDAASCSTIDQVMKYIDWVCNEYVYGDYGAIEACIIAYEYEDGVIEHYREIAQRYYTLGSHPARNKQWSALKLLTYRWEDGSLKYIDETP